MTSEYLRHGVTRDFIADVEQFYYREARLLDDRKFQQWLALLTEDIRYTVPVRHSPTLDVSERETEVFLSTENDISQGLAPPHRDENFLTLSIRVMRSFKANSWTDNPPARTRRFISNVEVQPHDEPDSFQVYSNLMLSYSRHRNDNYLYTAQRDDMLRLVDGNFRIARRTVIIDWNVVTAPSLGLFF